MAEMEREELEHWLEEVWKWWDQRETEPEQLELPFPVQIDPTMPKNEIHMIDSAGTRHKIVNLQEPGQDKIAGVSHDVAE